MKRKRFLSLLMTSVLVITGAGRTALVSGADAAGAEVFMEESSEIMEEPSEAMEEPSEAGEELSGIAEEFSGKKKSFPAVMERRIRTGKTRQQETGQQPCAMKLRVFAI